MPPKFLSSIFIFFSLHILLLKQSILYAFNEYLCLFHFNVNFIRAGIFVYFGHYYIPSIYIVFGM